MEYVGEVSVRTHVYLNHYGVYGRVTREVGEYVGEVSAHIHVYLNHYRICGRGKCAHTCVFESLLNMWER